MAAAIPAADLARLIDEMPKRRTPENDFEVVDSSDLTDADWAEINKLRRAYERGAKAFDTALRKLGTDPIRYAVVIGAFFPDMVRETIRDQLAEAGMTEDDVRELIRKVEVHGRRPH